MNAGKWIVPIPVGYFMAGINRFRTASAASKFAEAFSKAEGNLGYKPAVLHEDQLARRALR